VIPFTVGKTNLFFKVFQKRNQMGQLLNSTVTNLNVFPSLINLTKVYSDIVKINITKY
jgi:hypothetical protein